MNILFIIGKYPGYGGTEKMTTILANEFSRLDHNVFIASFESTAPELSSELHGPKLVGLRYPVRNATNVRILKKLIRERNIDYILNQWCLPFKVTMMINYARKGTSAKLVSVLHGVPNRSKILITAEDAVNNSSGARKIINIIKQKLIDRALRLSCRYVYRHSDRYVLLSESFIPAFSKYSGCKDFSRLYAIGNPISITTDYTTDYIRNKKNQILYVGRMDMENKRVNRIIDTWSLLACKHKDWSLHLVGDGPHKSELERYVKHNDIRNVVFHGFVPDEPTKFYKESKIFILTSDLEGFGLVIVEAMSYAVVPIIYGSYSSVYDIITPCKDGYITNPPFSAQKTANLIESLIIAPDNMETMALAAQTKSQNFELKSTVNKWLSLFDTLND